VGHGLYGEGQIKFKYAMPLQKVVIIPTNGTVTLLFLLYLLPYRPVCKMILELLNRVCRSLDDNRFPYMVSGSIALNIYAIPRMTRDIDIVIELPLKRIDEFIRLFPNSYLNKATMVEEIQQNGLFNIIDHETGFKLDFILRKKTDYFRQAFQRRKRIKEFNTELWVISLEDLIIAKLIWIQEYQSEQQMRDIEHLLLNSEKNMDYIGGWIHKLKLNTFDLFSHE
jgi:hypothetical protein